MKYNMIQLSPFEDSGRRLLANASVTFYKAGTTTLAVLYADTYGTAVAANPVITDAYGNLPPVFVAPGRYDYVVNGVTQKTQVGPTRSQVAGIHRRAGPAPVPDPFPLVGAVNVNGCHPGSVQDGLGCRRLKCG